MNHPQYEILKNGELFAFTREPFQENDRELCERMVAMLQSGRFSIFEKTAQLIFPAMGDYDILDAIGFVSEWDQLDCIMGHRDVLIIQPSKDEYSWRIKQAI